ncbi:hypothetical protein FRC10_004774 [Ceratobasidium sp. 414]|nr:hypothetical protein FRC10_004774 [Ceratobasidium sp. 414]
MTQHPGTAVSPNAGPFSEALLWRPNPVSHVIEAGRRNRTNPPRILYLAEEVDLPVEDYVKTARFDKECSAKAHVHASSLDEGGDSSGNKGIWSGSTSEYSSTTDETDPHEPVSIEAHLYYAGLRSKGRGPSSSIEIPLTSMRNPLAPRNTSDS